MVLHPLVVKKKVYTIFYSFIIKKKKERKKERKIEKKRKGSSFMNLTYR